MAKAHRLPDSAQAVVTAYRRGKSVDDIRKMHKLSRKAIYTILEREGTPQRELDANVEAEVVKAYQTGIRPAKIRKAFNISSVQLRNIIKRKAMSR